MCCTQRKGAAFKQHLQSHFRGAGAGHLPAKPTFKSWAKNSFAQILHDTNIISHINNTRAAVAAQLRNSLPKSNEHPQSQCQYPGTECDASEHQTRVPWMGWPSQCWFHTKKSCRPTKKAPQEGWHAKEHLTLPLPAASRHWKIQLFSMQFPLRNPEQHSTLLKANNQGEFHLFLLDWDCWTKNPALMPTLSSGFWSLWDKKDF